MMYPNYNSNTIKVSGVPYTTLNPRGLLASLINRFSRGDLTGAEISQNEFNASEAQKSREFSESQAQAQMAFQSREAEIARDWQEQMYNQYQSPGAMMRQYQNAGLNPALMYGGAAGGSIPNASSGPSGASGSVVSASGSLLSGGNLGLVASLAQLVKLRSEIDNIDADTANKTASAGLVSAQREAQNISNYVNNAVKDVNIEIAEANLATMLNNISKQTLDISEAEFNVSTQDVRRALLTAEKELKRWKSKEVEASSFMKSLEKSFYEEKGWQTPPSILVPIVTAGIIGGGNILGKVLEIAFGKKSKAKEIFVNPDTGEILK